MKSFQYFTMAIITLIAFTTSCSSSENEHEPDEPQTEEGIVIEDSFLSLVHENSSTGEVYAEFKAKGSWTASTEANWIVVDKQKGEAGEIRLKITVVSENESYEDRNAFVKIKSGKEEKTILVTQKKKDAIIADRDKIELTSTDTEFTIKVKSNINYEIVIDEETKGWIKHNTKSQRAGLTEKSENFVITTAIESEKRQGKITFKAGAIEEQVMIFQAEKGFLVLTNSRINLANNKDGSLLSIEVKTNVDFEVIIPDEAKSWVSIPVPNQENEKTDNFYLRVEPNGSGYARTCKIVVKDKNSNLKETLTIYQAWLNRLIVSNPWLDVPVEGASFEVELEANADYDIILPEGVEWVKQKAEGRVLSKYKHTFVVSKYDEPYYRQASVIFKVKGSQKEVKDSVVFAQNSGRNGIYKAEDLMELSSEYQRPFNDPLNPIILKKYGTYDEYNNKWIIEQKADVDLNPNLTFHVDDTYPDDVKITWKGKIDNRFTPIGNLQKRFRGDYNGNNYKIKNLFIETDTLSDVGLFGFANTSIIKNVNLERGLINASFKNDIRIGAVVGYIDGAPSIQNCVSSVHIYSKQKSTMKIGGIAGEALGQDPKSISNCRSLDNYLVGMGIGGDIGGILGRNAVSNAKNDASELYSNSKIYYSVDPSTTTANGTIGGLIGISGFPKISNCEFAGSIYVNNLNTQGRFSVSIGGILGSPSMAFPTLEAVKVVPGVTIKYKDVIASTNVGGLCGKKIGNIIASENHADIAVTHKQGEVGLSLGLAPEINGVIIASSNHGSADIGLGRDLGFAKGIVASYNVGQCYTAAFAAFLKKTPVRTTYWLDTSANKALVNEELSSIKPDYCKTEAQLKSINTVNELNDEIEKWNNENPELKCNYRYYHVPGGYPKLKAL